MINLCFADDLFLFAHGDANPARVIMACLDEFKDVYGLVSSLPKSTVLVIFVSSDHLGNGDLLETDEISCSTRIRVREVWSTHSLS